MSNPLQHYDAAVQDELGEEPLKIARDILAKMQAFGHATGCPAGGNVVEWFAARWASAQDRGLSAMRAALKP